MSSPDSSVFYVYSAGILNQPCVDFRTITYVSNVDTLLLLLKPFARTRFHIYAYELEETACECYWIVREERDRLTGIRTPHNPMRNQSR